MLEGGKLRNVFSTHKDMITTFIQTLKEERKEEEVGEGAVHGTTCTQASSDWFPMKTQLYVRMESASI